jgi:DNA processing protein
MTLRSIEDPEERLAWLALSLVPGLGPATFARLRERHGDAIHVLRARPGHAWLSAEVAAGIRDAGRDAGHTSATRVMDAATAAGARIVLAPDIDYPARLMDLNPRPPVLYVAGDLDAVAAASVAVVGTRRPSGYGRSVAAAIGDELGRAGLVAVSGLALGIDGIVQGATIDSGGRSVGVLPSPVDRVYPPAHRSLAARILQTGGALLSEVPPGRTIGKPDFARRNRIIAGLAPLVVVVEAPDRSGALLTAEAAIGIGRELLAIPGPIDAPQSQGTNRLIADHLAALLTSPTALIQAVGRQPVREGAGPIGLSPVERQVLARVVRRSASIEEIQAETGLDTGPLASALTLLEARGLVAAYAGATFHPSPAGRRLSGVR